MRASALVVIGACGPRQHRACFLPGICMSEPLWDRTHPFVIPVTASARHVDGYGHVSTHNYVQWMIDCAFAHSASLGLDEVTVNNGPGYGRDQLRCAAFRFSLRRR